VLAGLFAPGRWSLQTRWLAGFAGWLGLSLTAALASLVSLFLGVIVLFVLAWRHRRLARRPVVLTLLIVAAVVGSTLSLRHNDLGFIYKLSGKKETKAGQFESSWSQRLIYTYIGGRIFLDQPLTGTGWWGDPPPSTFARFVPAARRKFPDNPAHYFPPTDKPFIPQQTYDQVLYELGLIGAALLLAGFVAAGRAALNAARNATGTALDYVPLLWLAGLIGALAGEGLFGGIPLTTLLWLTFGLATYRRQPRAS
jgi:O-antigen ligase